MTHRSEVPDVPAEFDPEWVTLKAGTLLYRVHAPYLKMIGVNDGALFNPSSRSRMRWSPFGDPTIPVHYSAETPEAAVHESIFHDTPPRGAIAAQDWMPKVLSVLQVVRDVRLVSFCATGLRRFGLTARDLTDTPARSYRRTAAWAAAAHAAGAQGVVWMSRQYNTHRGFCLFGDRVGPGVVLPVLDSAEVRVFSLPADAEWVAQEALKLGITLSGHRGVPPA